MANVLTARQFWIRAPGRGEIVTAELGPRPEGHVLVRTLYSGVSRGTESLVFRGEVPESQRRAMRAPFQEGDFPGPVKYGYQSVGEVLEGPGPHGPVFCLFPHQDLYTVPASAVVPLPEGVPPERAVLAANLETAVNAVWDARPTAGDRIVVVGAGVVGLLVAWLCHPIPGVRLTVVDPDASRADVADELGIVDFAAEAPVAGEAPGDGADLVFHTSATPEGLAAALRAAATEATVVELSWYGSRSVPAPLGEAFHSRRLRLVSSQVGRIPAERAARWTHARRMALALGLLADSRLDALISGESRFDDLPRVMERLAAPGKGVLCHRIKY